MFLKIHKYLGKITFNKKIDSIFLHMIFKIDNHYINYICFLSCGKVSYSMACQSQERPSHQ